MSTEAGGITRDSLRDALRLLPEAEARRIDSERAILNGLLSGAKTLNEAVHGVVAVANASFDMPGETPVVECPQCQGRRTLNGVELCSLCRGIGSVYQLIRK